jgi:hypothetical protein
MPLQFGADGNRPEDEVITRRGIEFRMKEFDITVAVTAHSETVVAGPTMRSAELAIRAAEADGFRVERLIGLDAASELCAGFFTQPAFDGWKKAEFDVRDLGRARNELAKIARGESIAWLDADDLFSENWLVAGGRLLAEAHQSRTKIIVHPEMNWMFDTAPSAFVKPMQTDPLFTPHYFNFMNYYDSMCLTPREAVLEIPYTHYDFASGFAFEDWPWNIETMVAGWEHVIARDTVIFKRRRDASLVVTSGQRRTIIWPVEQMAIDKVSVLGRI